MVFQTIFKLPLPPYIKFYRNTKMSFTSLGLSPFLLNALSRQNYIEPTAVQKEVIPAVLEGKDLMGISPTGSGKTAGYVLPLLMNLQGKVISKNRHIDILVIVPTRELAVQVADVFKLFSSALPQKIKAMAVYGGVSINPQMTGMNGVNILVATPGRLLELLDSNAVHLSSVETLVLDEADKLLNLGFKEEMDRILKKLPRKRQNLLFSATLNKDVGSVQQILLKDPLVINIHKKQYKTELINQIAYEVPEEKKGPLLRSLIKSKGMKQVLIFASTVKKADNIANKLRLNGIDARSIHSKKSQGSRTDLLTKFRYKKLQVLVATDLISRGIDIEFLPFVINYELPRSPKDFIHRIGRTGRAESPGEAISFISADEEHHFKVIQKKIGKRIKLTSIEDMEL